MDTRGHEVVEFVAQYADELRGERLVQDGDRPAAVELVVLRHRTLGNLSTGALANFFDLLDVTHSTSSVLVAGRSLPARVHFLPMISCPDQQIARPARRRDPTAG